jgi:hypothetical protein
MKKSETLQARVTPETWRNAEAFRIAHGIKKESEALRRLLKRLWGDHHPGDDLNESYRDRVDELEEEVSRLEKKVDDKEAYSRALALGYYFAAPGLIMLGAAAKFTLPSEALYLIGGTLLIIAIIVADRRLIKKLGLTGGD